MKSIHCTLIQDRLRAARKRAILDSISGDRGEERPPLLAIRRTEEGLCISARGAKLIYHRPSPRWSMDRSEAACAPASEAAEMCNRKEARIILPDQSYEWWSRKDLCYSVTNEDDVMIQSERR